MVAREYGDDSAPERIIPIGSLPIADEPFPNAPLIVAVIVVVGSMRESYFYSECYWQLDTTNSHLHANVRTPTNKKTPRPLAGLHSGLLPTIVILMMITMMMIHQSS